jgi:hypothetical protein
VSGCALIVNAVLTKEPRPAYDRAERGARDGPDVSGIHQPGI